MADEIDAMFAASKDVTALDLLEADRKSEEDASDDGEVEGVPESQTRALLGLKCRFVVMCAIGCSSVWGIYLQSLEIESTTANLSPITECW